MRWAAALSDAAQNAVWAQPQEPVFGGFLEYDGEDPELRMMANAACVLVKDVSGINSPAMPPTASSGPFGSPTHQPTPSTPHPPPITPPPKPLTPPSHFTPHASNPQPYQPQFTPPTNTPATEPPQPIQPIQQTPTHHTNTATRRPHTPPPSSAQTSDLSTTRNLPSHITLTARTTPAVRATPKHSLPTPSPTKPTPLTNVDGPFGQHALNNAHPTATIHTPTTSTASATATTTPTTATATTTTTPFSHETTIISTRTTLNLTTPQITLHPKTERIPEGQPSLRMMDQHSSTVGGGKGRQTAPRHTSNTTTATTSTTPTSTGSTVIVTSVTTSTSATTSKHATAIVRPQPGRQPPEPLQPPYLFISFDLETTGLSKEKDRIVDIALITLPSISRKLNQYLHRRACVKTTTSMQDRTPMNTFETAAPAANNTTTDSTDDDALLAQLQRMTLTTSINPAAPSTSDAGLRRVVAETMCSAAGGQEGDYDPQQQAGGQGRGDGDVGDRHIHDGDIAQQGGLDLLNDVSEEWTTLVNPACGPWSEFVQNLTGISYQMTQERHVPNMRTALQNMVDWVEQHTRPGRLTPVLVAHNGQKFDIPFLIAEADREGLTLPLNWIWMDTLNLAQVLGLKSRTRDQRLTQESLKHLYRVKSGEQAHRALPDARVLAGILSSMITQEDALQYIVQGLAGRNLVAGCV